MICPDTTTHSGTIFLPGDFLRTINMGRREIEGIDILNGADGNRMDFLNLAGNF